MIRADYHMHSSYSGDSDAKQESMILSAINKGITHICFTDHQDFDFPVDEECPAGYFEFNTDQYFFDVAMLKAKYDELISINIGVELGMQEHLAESNDVYVGQYDFDFVIASSHLCHGKDPYRASFYEGRTEKEAYHEYFQSIYDNIKLFQNFDVYGHLDYALRYGPTKNQNFVLDEYKEEIDKILHILIDNGKGIEVNTSGYAKGMNGPNPCKDIILEYKKLGGEILTIGSDAHKPSDIAADYDKAEALIKECGFDHYYIFNQRKPEVMRF